MAANTVNFFQPGTESAVDANAILRQRELAKMLMQQGVQGQGGQMVGAHYVPPSPLSYVTQLASALTGKYLGDKADERELTLGQQIRARNAAEAQAFTQAMQGTPATPGRDIPPLTPNDDEGNAMPVARQEGTAAKPPDQTRALAMALQSQNPMLQQLAPEIIKRQMDAAELKSALQAAGITPSGAPAAGANGSMPGGAGTGLPEGISPQAFALTLARNPQAQALGKMIQDANKPQTLAEGGTLVTPGGRIIMTAPKTEAGIAVQGGQAVPIPGFAEAQASRAGQIAKAEAVARDPYAALVQVNTAEGPRMMTPAQARTLAQGNVPDGGVGNGGGPVNGRPIPNPMAPRPEDTDRGLIYKQELDAAAQRLSAAQQAGDPAAAARAQQDIAGLLKEVKSNRIQVPQEATPSVAGSGRGGQGGPGIPLMSEEQKAYGEARAKGFAEQASNVQKTGQTGASMLRNLDQLRTLYSDPNVAKGALAENISGLKNIGASFGIDMKGLSSEQAAQAITNKMALDARSTADGGGMPGAMSDADRNFLKNLQPDLSKSPEGRAKIMDAMQRVAQRQIDVARLATEYEQRNGRLDAGFDRVVQDYAAKNQMFTQPTRGGGSKTDINELLRKYR